MNFERSASVRFQYLAPIHIIYTIDTQTTLDMPINFLFRCNTIEGFAFLACSYVKFLYGFHRIFANRLSSLDHCSINNLMVENVNPDTESGSQVRTMKSEFAIAQIHFP